MPERADRTAYWQWKCRECRVAARFVTDIGDRLALLQLAAIYRRFAEKPDWPRFRPDSRGVSETSEPRARKTATTFAVNEAAD